jgi:von Willebrand factor type A domain/Aerotolerance regulator N-terminal
MGFVFAFALAAVALVAAPYFAHRLRRRRADTRPFAPAHLVTPAPPRARRRSALEDRALFATRALAVIALSLLGASPFVRCARLSLSRPGGASVALTLVVDDSLSMKDPITGKSRFARALAGASELLSSTREGDAVAVVLAGAPARVALAPTTDLRNAASVVAALTATDRATDLDGALALARGLMDGLPQEDRRIVVLSDLADGHPEGAPLGEGSPVPVWNALPLLRADGTDCAVVRADRAGPRARVHVACSPGSAAARGANKRKVALVLRGKKIAEEPAPAADVGDVDLRLPDDARSQDDEPGALVAQLSPGDAIADDDVAPVVTEASRGSIAIVAEPESETAATGGPPVVEQALSALDLDLAIRPIPEIPDHAEDLGAFVGVILDDPPGLTPEERRALGAFVERGGVLLLALGPRAAAPPLGANLEPFVAHAITWDKTTDKGADPASALPPLAESGASLADLHASSRAVLHPDDVAAYDARLRWTDHAPLIAEKALGRGEVWLTTLPFALDESDLPLRPAFLSLLDAFASAAQSKRAPRRTAVGVPWTFPGATRVTAKGPSGAELVARRDGAVLRIVPSLLGLYRLDIDGRAEMRVAEVPEQEVDLRPRRLTVDTAGRALGDSRSAVDVSPVLALVLLGLFTLELALRIRAVRSQTPVSF